MKTINIDEAKIRLSHLVDEVRDGEVVIIARRNKPVARLVPESSVEKRKIGTAAGKIKMAIDFDTIPAEFDDYS